LPGSKDGFPPADYWPTPRRLCSQYGTLLITDEVQTAWNRTGKWFATEYWASSQTPLMAMALGSGFPIAAYITTHDFARHYTRPGASTFGGNLVSCQAALATPRFHHRYRLGQRSTELGNEFRQRLREVQQRVPPIADVRGLGLMIGVELRTADGAPAPTQTDLVLERMKDAGYLIGKTGQGRNVLTFMPPLVIEPSELDGAADSLARILSDLS
jgi:4-aminobutyrate aminotransferase-like enzyme